MIALSELCIYAVLVQIVWTVLPWIYKTFLATPITDFKQFGEWVVITGASDGIGKEFCKEFAARVLNVVLISRTKSKSDSVAKELQDTFKVKTKVISVDFTDGLEIYETIKRELEGLDIGILVNNVGMMYPGPYAFHEMTERGSAMQDMINCNLISVPYMTKLVIPKMIEKNRGLILNLSSLAANLPTPITLYSATKAYVKKFTDDLALEYAGTGIQIQSINPGPVLTNMWTVEGGKITKPTADVYVKAAMGSIGTGRHVIGYYPHIVLDLLCQVMNFFFPALYRKVVVYSFKKAKQQ